MADSLTEIFNCTDGLRAAFPEQDSGQFVPPAMSRTLIKDEVTLKKRGMTDYGPDKELYSLCRKILDVQVAPIRKSSSGLISGPMLSEEVLAMRPMFTDEEWEEWLEKQKRFSAILAEEEDELSQQQDRLWESAWMEQKMLQNRLEAAEQFLEREQRLLRAQQRRMSAERREALLHPDDEEEGKTNRFYGDDQFTKEMREKGLRYKTESEERAIRYEDLPPVPEDFSVLLQSTATLSVGSPIAEDVDIDDNVMDNVTKSSSAMYVDEQVRDAMRGSPMAAKARLLNATDHLDTPGSDDEAEDLHLSGTLPQVNGNSKGIFA
eukprot:Clim_evm53s153 gene=Clim_evmTU53s153